METQFLIELNDDLKNGRPTAKSKKSEFIPKVAAGLHVLEHAFKQLKENNYIELIPESISLETLERAILYLDSLEEQKDLFMTVRIPFKH